MGFLVLFCLYIRPQYVVYSHTIGFSAGMSLSDRCDPQMCGETEPQNYNKCREEKS